VRDLSIPQAVVARQVGVHQGTVSRWRREIPSGLTPQAVAPPRNFRNVHCVAAKKEGRRWGPACVGISFHSFGLRRVAGPRCAPNGVFDSSPALFPSVTKTKHLRPVRKPSARSRDFLIRPRRRQQHTVGVLRRDCVPQIWNALQCSIPPRAKADQRSGKCEAI
jgi:hypothetical protein